MNAHANPKADPRDRDEAINEALYDAVCDGEGRPRADALAHHLAKHGFVIVEMNPPATPSNNLALTLKSTEAIWNAISRSRDGYPGVEIGEELAKRGLAIVESARYGKLRTTLQLVVSVLEPFVTDMGASAFPPGVWRALRRVVTKIGEL